MDKAYPHCVLGAPGSLIVAKHLKSQIGVLRVSCQEDERKWSKAQVDLVDTSSQMKEGDGVRGRGWGRWLE